jgi:hypothetical protein
MRREQRPRSLIRNLSAGAYNPFQRVAVIVANTFRKIPGGGCCGHYGEPGC